MMAKKLAQIMEKIPLERRNRIEARAKKLMDEHPTLRDLSKARELTHERMAELLKICEHATWHVQRSI